MGTIKNIKTAAQVAGVIAGSAMNPGSSAAKQAAQWQNTNNRNKTSTSIQQPRNQAKTSGR